MAENAKAAASNKPPPPAKPLPSVTLRLSASSSHKQQKSSAAATAKDGLRLKIKLKPVEETSAPKTTATNGTPVPSENTTQQTNTASMVATAAAPTAKTTALSKQPQAATKVSHHPQKPKNSATAILPWQVSEPASTSIAAAAVAPVVAAPSSAQHQIASLQKLLQNTESTVIYERQEHARILFVERQKNATLESRNKELEAKVMRLERANEDDSPRKNPATSSILPVREDPKIAILQSEKDELERKVEDLEETIRAQASMERAQAQATADYDAVLRERNELRGRLVAISRLLPVDLVGTGLLQGPTTEQDNHASEVAAALLNFSTNAARAVVVAKKPRSVTFSGRRRRRPRRYDSSSPTSSSSEESASEDDEHAPVPVVFQNEKPTAKPAKEMSEFFAYDPASASKTSAKDRRRRLRAFLEPPNPRRYARHMDLAGDQWMQSYRELIRYYNKHGNFNVRLRSGYLGRWVHRQRAMKRNHLRGVDPDVSEEVEAKIHLLDLIGFQWVGSKYPPKEAQDNSSSSEEEAPERPKSPSQQQSNGNREKPAPVNGISHCIGDTAEYSEDYAKWRQELAEVSKNIDAPENEEWRRKQREFITCMCDGRLPVSEENLRRLDLLGKVGIVLTKQERVYLNRRITWDEKFKLFRQFKESKDPNKPIPAELVGWVKKQSSLKRGINTGQLENNYEHRRRLRLLEGINFRFFGEAKPPSQNYMPFSSSDPPPPVRVPTHALMAPLQPATKPAENDSHKMIMESSDDDSPLNRKERFIKLWWSRYDMYTEYKRQIDAGVYLRLDPMLAKWWSAAKAIKKDISKGRLAMNEENQRRIEALDRLGIEWPAPIDKQVLESNEGDESEMESVDADDETTDGGSQSQEESSSHDDTAVESEQEEEAEDTGEDEQQQEVEDDVDEKEPPALQLEGDDRPLDSLSKTNFIWRENLARYKQYCRRVEEGKRVKKDEKLLKWWNNQRYIVYDIHTGRRKLDKETKLRLKTLKKLGVQFVEPKTTKSRETTLAVDESSSSSSEDEASEAQEEETIDRHAKDWQQMYSMFVEYEQDLHDTSMLEDSKMNPALGSWVKKQRSFLLGLSHREILTQEFRRRLNLLIIHDDFKWYYMVGHLRHFLSVSHRGAEIPYDYLGGTLREFADQQKEDYHATKGQRDVSTAYSERLSILRGIGFDFGPELKAVISPDRETHGEKEQREDTPLSASPDEGWMKRKGGNQNGDSSPAKKQKTAVGGFFRSLFGSRS